MNYKIGKEWEGLGRMIDVEVEINGQTYWTTRIQKKGETIEQVLEKVREVFEPVAKAE